MKEIKSKISILMAKIVTLFYSGIFVFQKNYCDAFDTAGVVANNLFEKMKTLCEAIFPAALIITCCCMFFTRDDKKLASERHILIGLIGAFLLVEIIGLTAGGTGIVETFKNFVQ